MNTQKKMMKTLKFLANWDHPPWVRLDVKEADDFELHVRIRVGDDYAAVLFNVTGVSNSILDFMIHQTVAALVARSHEELGHCPECRRRPDSFGKAIETAAHEFEKAIHQRFVADTASRKGRHA